MSHITPSFSTRSPMDVPPSSGKGKEEEDVSISVSLEQEPLEVALIDTLPLEILAIIFQLATNNGKDPNTLCRMREVSRFWHQLIEGSAEDKDLYRYGLLSSLWNKFKGKIQHPFLKERIALIDLVPNNVLIDRSVSLIIASPDDDSYDEESVLFLDSTHFSHFQDLSRELTGAPLLLGFEAAPYEKMQRALDASLEQIWPRIRNQIDFAGAPIPDNAQAIRGWLNDPANAEKIARITYLNLSEMHLQVLPPEIGKLSQLTGLNLTANWLADLPESIGNLSNLTTLLLSANRLANLPESIGNLSNLTVLYLTENQLTSLPTWIGNLSQLETLDLQQNKLTSLPKSIGNLSQLTRLNLYDNLLSSLPESFGNLSRLTGRYERTGLNLSENRLTSLPESIGNLSELQVLFVQGNLLTSLPESIGNLSQLEGINLHANRITSLPESIGNLSQLKWLKLERNKLTSLPESIHNLSQLTYLYPYCNPLLFILNRHFYQSYSEQVLPHQVMTHQHVACSNYVCRMPLASLCQEIHRGKEDEVLRNAFKNLSHELQQQIHQAWSAIHSSSGSSSEAAPDLFADRASLTKAIITVLQNRWNALTADQRRQTYAQVAILAGQPQADAHWGEAHAEENIIRLIDAMELVTQK